MTSTIRGNDGFDSAQYVNLLNTYAGRNKIINGNFDIWQRATSQTTVGYGSDDRWFNTHVGPTVTYSRQTFALGQTDVPGNPKYYARLAVSSVTGEFNYCNKNHNMEGVNTFAGETVTLSFWAKADSTKNMAVEFEQIFGTGGSPSDPVNSIGAQLVQLTTVWTKYVLTVAIPSIAGKTLGTSGTDYLQLKLWFDAGSGYDARTASLGNQSGTFDIAQLQLEVGTEATEFERRPIWIELALCQRYYAVGAFRTASFCYATGNWVAPFMPFLNQMRAVPSIVITISGGYPTGTWTAQAEVNGFRAIAEATGTKGDNDFVDGTWTANAEL